MITKKIDKISKTINFCPMLYWSSLQTFFLKVSELHRPLKKILWHWFGAFCFWSWIRAFRTLLHRCDMIFRSLSGRSFSSNESKSFLRRHCCTPLWRHLRLWSEFAPSVICRIWFPTDSHHILHMFILQ